jgi:UDP-2,3-diacylglucosamine hydrolase
MHTLFISDLHLSGQRADLRALFLRFLRERAQGAAALYILGDLFEAWLGDDLVLPEYQPVLEALRTVTAAGTPIYVMHGNRDFLLGDAFAQQTGCTLLAEPAVIELHGRRALLLHGDTLCTDDLPYQQMRTQLRHPGFIATFLAKPPQERVAFAQQLRARSQEETSRKQEYIMDVNTEAVAAAYRTHGVDLLIHGHTHRLGRHTFPVDGRKVERIVLGDWDRVGSVLVADGEGLEMVPFT